VATSDGGCAADWAIPCCAAAKRMHQAEENARQALDALIDRCWQDEIDPDSIIGARVWLRDAVRQLRRATTARTSARPCEATHQRS
jgi:hypothetical protein